MQDNNRANNALKELRRCIECRKFNIRYLPALTGKNVPIKEIAKVMGKDAQYVRVGIQQGVLKFGVAIKMEDSNEYNYYCPDKKVWEETGYFRSIPETV